MSLVVNHNLMAANTARNLNTHYGRLATSTQRLSSGLRINGAADDAAGLAIRELMRADMAALHQGVRNANDAISMIQVVDGALSIIDEKLIRMKELAEQAATGTYNSTQRLMIHSEFVAMGEEIDRIARATNFNGIKLLDGSLSGAHDGRGLNSTGKMKIHFGSANDSAEDYYYVEIGDCTTGGLGLRNQGTKNIKSIGYDMPSKSLDSPATKANLTGEHKYTELGFGPDYSELNNFYTPGDWSTHDKVIDDPGGHNPRSFDELNLDEGQWYGVIDNLAGGGCANFMLLIPAGTKNFVFNQIGSIENTGDDM